MPGAVRSEQVGARGNSLAPNSVDWYSHIVLLGNGGSHHRVRKACRTVEAVESLLHSFKINRHSHEQDPPVSARTRCPSPKRTSRSETATAKTKAAPQ